MDATDRIANKLKIQQTSSAPCPNRNRHGVAEATTANVLKLRAECESKGCDGADSGNITHQDKSLTRDRSSKKEKTSYVSSLIAKQGNMDEFHEIQANLCVGRDHGNDVPEDGRHYDPQRDREDDNDTFLYPCIPVLQQRADGRQPLPVSTNGDLPHFVINIGHSTSAPNPSLTPCANTGAGANVGYIRYFDGILFHHSECVE